MDTNNEQFLVGIFDDEDVLMQAVKKVRSSGVKIFEVFTPFPIHNLDVALGYKRSRLPRAAFMFGLTGTSCALLMQIWMMGFDWPMVIGGKNYIPLPDFVPVGFELTVLFAALGMVATFLISNNLGPGKQPRMFDVRSTDDKFVMAIEMSRNTQSADDITTLLKNNGAVEVNTKHFEPRD